MTSEEALFEHLARILDYWVESATAAFSDSSADLAWSENPQVFREVAQRLERGVSQSDLRSALAEILRGQLHSVLVALDCGSDLAETTTLTITDQDGNVLDDGLHEKFFEHLAKTGRL